VSRSSTEDHAVKRASSDIPWINTIPQEELGENLPQGVQRYIST